MPPVIALYPVQRLRAMTVTGVYTDNSSAATTERGLYRLRQQQQLRHVLENVAESLGVGPVSRRRTFDDQQQQLNVCDRSDVRLTTIDTTPGDDLRNTVYNLLSATCKLLLTI